MNKNIVNCLFIIICASLCSVAAAVENDGVESEYEKKSLHLDAFAMMPLIRNVSVSDDGKKIAIVRATSKEGDYIIEIRSTLNLKEKPVILGANKMLVSNITWLNNERIGVTFRQIVKSGSRKYWVNRFAIVNANGKGDWLVPSRNKKLSGFALIDKLPDNENEILAQTDINNNYIPDLIRYNIKTGRSINVLRGNTKVSGGFMTDFDGEVRAALGWNQSDNTIDAFAREKGSNKWKLVKQVSPKQRDNFGFLGFSKENPNEIYINTNRGEDKTGIYLYNIKTGEYSERLFGLEKVDAGSIMTDKKGNLLGFTYTSKYLKRYFVDENEKALYESLKPLFKNKQIAITSRSDDDNALVVRTSSSKDSGSYYLITNKNKLEKIGERKPLLQEDILAKVRYVTYKARDGRKIKAYVTTPKGKGPFPAIVLPHGGPWVRDTIVFDEWSQLLAYHGYVVIQPNYRGSTGYGLEHWIAGDKRWGLTMQDDLDDAAMYLVEKGLARKDKLAMFGWSYGGYAAFVASMRDNNIYQCTVAGAGVSDIGDMRAETHKSRFIRLLQRPTVEGINPINQVEKVNVPILVIHGDIDRRVNVSHSRRFVEKLVEYKKDHKYIELKDADHFHDTLFYNHKTTFYSELLSWLDNKCQLKD